MRLPRFTTRRLMVLVAVVASLLGVSVGLWRRSVEFERLAVYHAAEEDRARNAPMRSLHGDDELRDLRFKAEDARLEAESHRRSFAESRRSLDAKLAAGEPTTQAERREPWYWQLRADEAEWARRVAELNLDFYESRIAYHLRMRLRFERASARPWEWVAVEPEPAREFRPPELPHPAPPPP